MQNQKQELIQTALRAASFLGYLGMNGACTTAFNSAEANKLAFLLKDAADEYSLDEPMRFTFELDQIVALAANPDEQGQVIARAQYTNGCNQYWVRYRNGNNVSVEVWWAEDALIATE